MDGAINLTWQRITQGLYFFSRPMQEFSQKRWGFRQPNSPTSTTKCGSSSAKEEEQWTSKVSSKGTA